MKSFTITEHDYLNLVGHGNTCPFNADMRNGMMKVGAEFLVKYKDNAPIKVRVTQNCPWNLKTI